MAGTRYLVPRPMRRGFEFLPGWGVAELGIAAPGVIVGGGMAALAHAMHAPAAAQLLGWVIPAAVGIGLALPQPTGENLAALIRAWWQFGHRPRRWLLRFPAPTPTEKERSHHANPQKKIRAGG
ncbi:MAG: hypothetical protein OWS74_07775 [Firmicutes bacterium]|nr:hypothetical protein [Bacillota bacterium]